ncbi:intercellular adhesion molecule 1-like isoform X1 [Chanos chanos]|uniref:Intercellular adhesion molecule 1-like isoform X1 n=2 Tax=Chanos chanos TaxID=29144 RepID=A0A6J2WQ84_CHACN|nr:intercellular adhesion molecule 3 isoform X1 [Chanos chanos]
MSVLPKLVYLASFVTFRVSCGNLKLNPPKVVVRFGDPVSVNCSTSTKHYGMGWEAPVGAVDLRDNVNVITWTVPELTDWDMEAICFINSDDVQHSKTLSVIVYKTPDSVSVSYVNHTGPVMEKTQYELQCDIKNIAPVQYLTVRWYKGQTLVDSQTFTDDSKTPVNVSAPLLITPSRADHGAQYRCEAELDLGAEGPQPPPTVQAKALNVEVCLSCGNLKLNPPKVVVRFGDPVSVNCSTSTKHYGMGWEAPVGGVDMRDDVNVITWTVPELTDWDMEAICFINTDDGQHSKTLSVIVYKTPDSVSVSYVNHTGPVMEKTQYELQCDIKNIAPVQYLTVRWYKGQTLVDSQTFTDDSKTPVNVSAPLLITPSRADDGAQYWCEAELDLGAEGPQPPPRAQAKALNVEVWCKYSFF